MRQSEFIKQALNTCRLLDRIEILALDIFDKPHCQRRFIRHAPNHCGHLGQTRKLSGSPAAFTCDQFVSATGCFPHQQRLNDPLGGN